MTRFKRRDPVRILPQFAHLYPNPIGVVIDVKEDAWRSVFNEYTVEFPDGSTAGLFEFQLAESE